MRKIIALIAVVALLIVLSCGLSLLFRESPAPAKESAAAAGTGQRATQVAFDEGSPAPTDRKVVAEAGYAPAAPRPLAAAAEGSPVLSHCLVMPIDEAMVPAQEAGVIASIKAVEGQTVRRGDLLAQIDDAIPQSERDKAVAEQRAAKEKADSDVDIRYAKAAAGVADYAYQKNVLANQKVPGAVPQVEVNRLKLEWDRALLQIEQAQLEQKLSKLTADTKAAEVKSADEAIHQRRIESPLDGVVVQITPHVGEWVKPGDTVLHVVRIDRLKIEGYLNSGQYSPQEIADRPVSISVKLAHYPQPVEFTGRIVFVGPLDEAGGDYRVKAEIDNRVVPGRTDQWLLRPGASPSMKIELN